MRVSRGSWYSVCASSTWAAKQRQLRRVKAVQMAQCASEPRQLVLSLSQLHLQVLEMFEKMESVLHCGRVVKLAALQHPTVAQQQSHAGLQLQQQQAVAALGAIQQPPYLQLALACACALAEDIQDQRGAVRNSNLRQQHADSTCTA